MITVKVICQFIDFHCSFPVLLRAIFAHSNYSTLLIHSTCDLIGARRALNHML